MTRKPKPTRGSGAPTEAYYEARGYVRKQLRLKRAVATRLARLAAENETSEGQVVSKLIMGEEET